MYQRDLRLHVLPLLASVKVRAITASMIDKVLVSARDTSKKNATKNLPLSSSGRRRLRTLIGSVLGHAVRHDILAKNVCRQVETPAAEYQERTPLTVEEVVAILAAVRGHDLEGVVTVAIGSGARRGELCGLRVSDVNFTTGEYSISRAVKNVGPAVVVGKVKTKKSNRKDVLPSFALEAVRAHRLRQRERFLACGARVDDPYLFCNGEGGPLDPNTLSRRWLDFVRAKKLRPCRLHDLRHACASMAFAAGVSLKVVSESLGHSSVGVTSSVYTHLFNDAMAAKSTALDTFVSEAVKKAATKGA